MLAEVRTGIVQAQDGAVNPARADRFGDIVTQDAVGKFYEIARQGRIFVAAMQAGASLGTALTATAVTVTLYNPSGSGVNLSLIQCAIAVTTEATVAAGAKTVLVYAANVNTAAAAPTATTALTVRGALLGGPAGQGQAYSAATLPAVPVIVRVHPLGLNNQTAAGDAMLAMTDNVEGALSLAPNTAVTIQGIATASSGIISVVWAEIPV